MNYFFRELLSWPKWYFVLLAFLMIVTFTMIEIFTGVFGTTLIFTLYAFFTAGTAVYGFFTLNVRRQYLSWERELDALEADLKQELEHRRLEQPGYQTMCYKCIHFDRGLTHCQLHLPGRSLFYKLEASDTLKYCLYWNHRFSEKFLQYLVTDKEKQK